MTSRLRAGGVALLCMVAMSALQGCIVTRVMDTRAQLCDEQPSRVTVSRKGGSGLRILFETPILTEQDVIWIVASKPTEARGAGAVRELFYEAVPVHRPLDRAAGLVSKLSFKRVQGEYRLAEVEVPEKFDAVLPPALLDAALKVLCKTRIGIFPPSTTFDLTEIDRATLPGRDALRQLLGPPTAVNTRGNEISYQYCLAPCDTQASMVAKLTFTFGDPGELQRAEASYFRYSAVVDLVSSRPTATISLHDRPGEGAVGAM